MLQALALKVFFFVPIWVLKIFFFKKLTVIRGHQFDPQAAAFLSVTPKTNLSVLSDNQIAETRKTIDESRKKNKLSLSPSRKITKKDHLLPNHKLLLREYQPINCDEKKAVLYFHGGGYVLSSVDTHDDMVSYMSDSLGIKFYSLDYRLSPENKYPDSLNDALEAYAWLINRGFSPKEISVSGDSAGAHLAASMVHYLSNRDQELPGSQFLIYPMCDPSCSTESYELLSSGYFLTKSNMIWFWDKLRGHKEDDVDSSFNLAVEMINHSAFTPLFRNSLQNYPYKNILSDEFFDFEYIDQIVDKFINKIEISGDELNILIPLCSLYFVGIY